ncbi:MAG: hypothetical protein J6S30_02670 [Kiritimatiellae bacterium]|nr:hypothetical protein [Kiritimatiellia bacterium]
MAFENGVHWNPRDPEKRGRHSTFDSALKSVVASIAHTIGRDEFFDSIVDRWAGLFPGCQARPGRRDSDRIVLYVSSAPVLFMMRPKLPQMKRVLAALPGAPKRLALVLEIRK